MTSQLSRRIEKLERHAALNVDEEQRLQVVANAAVIGRLAERIRQLETAALEQHDRIGRLEAALGPWLEEMTTIVSERDISPSLRKTYTIDDEAQRNLDNLMNWSILRALTMA